MSKGSDSTTVQQADPWIGQQPYLQTGFQQALGNLNNPRQFYPGATYVPFSGQSEAAMGMLEGRATNNPLSQGLGDYALGNMSANPGLGSVMDQGAFGALQGTARGDMLNANPYLDQMFGEASRAVTDRFNEAVMPSINSAFSRAGRTADDTHGLVAGEAAGGLADALGGMAANIYGGNYAQERSNQLNAATGLGNMGLGLYGQNLGNQRFAASMLPTANQMQLGDIQGLAGVGQQVEGMAGNVLQDAISRHQFDQTEPDDALGRYIAAIQGNYGGQSVSTTDPGSNPVAGALGGGLAGGGLAGALGANSLFGTAGATGLAGMGAWPLMLGGALLGAFS